MRARHDFSGEVLSMVGRNILIVDDEAPIREMIAVALEMAGYDCLEAENSQQAHAIIVDRKPCLLYTSDAADDLLTV